MNAARSNVLLLMMLLLAWNVILANGGEFESPSFRLLRNGPNSLPVAFCDEGLYVTLVSRNKEQCFIASHADARFSNLSEGQEAKDVIPDGTFTYFAERTGRKFALVGGEDANRTGGNLCGVVSLLPDALKAELEHLGAKDLEGAICKVKMSILYYRLGDRKPKEEVIEFRCFVKKNREKGMPVEQEYREIGK